MSLFLNMFKSKKKEDENNQSHDNQNNDHHQNEEKSSTQAESSLNTNPNEWESEKNENRYKEKTFYIDEQAKPATQQKGKFGFIKKKANQTEKTEKEKENVSQTKEDTKMDDFLNENKESLRNNENSVKYTEEVILRDEINEKEKEKFIKKESNEISVTDSSSKQVGKTKFGFKIKVENENKEKQKEKEKEKEDSISDKLSITDSISKANQLKKDLINKEYKEKTNKTDEIEKEKAKEKQKEEKEKSEVEILKERCEEEIKKNNHQFLSIYQTINKHKEIIFNINNQIHKKEIEISMIEESLQHTLMNEDFVKADELENKKKYIYNKIDEHKEEIFHYKNEIFKMKEKEVYTYRTFLKSYSELSLSYGKLKSLASKDIDDFYQKDMSKFKNEQFIVKKLKEKVENLSQNLELKKEEIQQDNDFLEKLVKEQCQDIYEERTELKSQREVILNEIEDLKRKLEEKLVKVDELNMQIEKRDNDIDAIKSNFKREYQKINNKKAKYDEDINDLQEENEKLSMMEKRLLENEENNKKKIELLVNVKESYGKDMEKYGLLSSKLSEEIEKKAENIKKESDLNEKLRLLRESYKKTDEMIIFNKNEISVIELNIRNHENEISSLDLKVPSLEESKIKHVNSKNYKEAGKVSAELKRISELKTGLQGKIFESTEKISLLQNETNEKEGNLKEIEESISQCNIEIDKITYINSVVYKDSQMSLYNELKVKGDLINAQNLKKGIEQLKEEIKVLKEKEHIRMLIEVKEIEENEIQSENKRESKLSKGESVVEEKNISKFDDETKEDRQDQHENENKKEENEKKDEEKEKENEDEVKENEEEVMIIEKKETIIEKNENQTDDNLDQKQKDLFPKEEELNIYKESKLKIEKLNTDLEEALQVEDYELADSIQNQIDNENEVISQIESMYKDYFEKIYFHNS